MDLTRLSTNIIDVIDAILKNQELVNLIGYDGNFPIDSASLVSANDISPKGSKARIFPYPFDVKYTGEVISQIHVYYPNFDFVNNGNANEVILIFDIVVHKSIWLMMDNGKKVIRPYQIAKEIVNTFRKKSIGKLGEIHFINGSHTIINSEFEGLRIVSKFTEF